MTKRFAIDELLPAIIAVCFLASVVIYVHRAHHPSQTPNAYTWKVDAVMRLKLDDVWLVWNPRLKDCYLDITGGAVVLVPDDFCKGMR